MGFVRSALNFPLDSSMGGLGLFFSCSFWYIVLNSSVMGSLESNGSCGGVGLGFCVDSSVKAGAGLRLYRSAMFGLTLNGSRFLAENPASSRGGGSRHTMSPFNVAPTNPSTVRNERRMAGRNS